MTWVLGLAVGIPLGMGLLALIVAFAHMGEEIARLEREVQRLKGGGG